MEPRHPEGQKLPLQALRIMAGHDRKKGLYYLPRSGVQPPEELAKLIFPFIEGQLEHCRGAKTRLLWHFSRCCYDCDPLSCRTRLRWRSLDSIIWYSTFLSSTLDYSLSSALRWKLSINYSESVRSQHRICATWHSVKNRFGSQWHRRTASRPIGNDRFCENSYWTDGLSCKVWLIISVGSTFAQMRHLLHLPVRLHSKKETGDSKIICCLEGTHRWDPFETNGMELKNFLQNAILLVFLGAFNKFKASSKGKWRGCWSSADQKLFSRIKYLVGYTESLITSSTLESAALDLMDDYFNQKKSISALEKFLISLSKK